MGNRTTKEGTGEKVDMWSKIRMLLAVMTLGTAMLLCGCGESADKGGVPEETSGTSENRDAAGAGETEQEGSAGTLQSQETEQTVQNVDSGYYFIINEVTVAVDMDMDELVSQLPEAKSVFEAPSCAGEGISYIYIFSSYEIETYPAEDGKNRIGFITLKDDTVATVEGVDLSMSKEDAVLVYGENYDESPSQITYEKDGMKLNFIFEEDSIISIEYVSSVIG